MRDLTKQKRTITTNGYISVYCPEHPKAWANSGSILEHRLVAEKMLGRYLEDDEDVHHLDNDKTNNHPNNLLVLHRAQHTKLHSFLDNHYLIPKPTSLFKNNFPVDFCLVCNEKIFSGKKYCSPECYQKSTKKLPEDLTPEILKDLVWSKPTSAVAKDFNVSDTSIAKWCKKLMVPKPPRGYWTQVKNNFGAVV